MQCVPVNRVDILVQRSQQPRYIGRTAGTAEPALPFRLHMMLAWIAAASLRPYLQRIDIEIMLAVLRHGPQHIIIERPLHHVRIPGFRG
ncbi:hypothetical protein D3C86_1977230 [compost metagenome]